MILKLAICKWFGLFTCGPAVNCALGVCLCTMLRSATSVSNQCFIPLFIGADLKCHFVAIEASKTNLKLLLCESHQKSMFDIEQIPIILAHK